MLQYLHGEGSQQRRRVRWERLRLVQGVREGPNNRHVLHDHRRNHLYEFYVHHAYYQLRKREMGGEIVVWGSSIFPGAYQGHQW